MEQLFERAKKQGSEALVLDWAGEGLARCRFKATSGMRDVIRYPAPVQTALVGLLQMLSKNVLGNWGVQEGKVSIGGQVFPVSIVPTSHGMMATVSLAKKPKDQMGWMRALSSLQQALIERTEPNIEELRKARPDEESDSVTKELLETLTINPLPRTKALNLLARLASQLHS